MLVFLVLLLYFGTICPVGLTNLPDLSQNLLDITQDLNHAITELCQISNDDSVKCKYLGGDLLGRLRTLEEDQTSTKRATQLEFKNDLFYFLYQYFSVAYQILLCFLV